MQNQLQEWKGTPKNQTFFGAKNNRHRDRNFAVMRNFQVYRDLYEGVGQVRRKEAEGEVLLVGEHRAFQVSKEGFRRNCGEWESNLVKKKKKKKTKKKKKEQLRLYRFTKNSLWEGFLWALSI
jgi:hypothetical protein